MFNANERTIAVSSKATPNLVSGIPLLDGRCSYRRVVPLRLGVEDRHRQEWDPPWLRHRPARGPPRQLELFDEFEESQLPASDPEEENQDAPGDRWLE